MQSKSGVNRLWLRTVGADEKIIKERVFEWQKEGMSALVDLLRRVCEELDEPTPIVLKSHYQDLKNFNVTRFSARDFIESIYFEKMILELVK